MLRITSCAFFLKELFVRASLWRKHLSPQSGDFYLKLSINLPARNVISGKNALPVRSYKQFF